MGKLYKSDLVLHVLSLHRSLQFLLHLLIMTNADLSSADIRKNEVETVESIHKPTLDTRGKDKAAELLASNERIIVTAEENRRVLRKIDLIILPILLSVYFLQSLGKLYALAVVACTDIGPSRQDNTFVRLGLRSHRRC